VPTNTPTPEPTATATIPVAGATGGRASVSVPLTTTETTTQPPDQPVSFTVTVGLPEGVTASAATCEIAGATCQATIVDPSTITASGEVPAGELAQQPPVTVDFTVGEPAPSTAPAEASACTVIGEAAPQPAGTCGGTQTEVAFTVAPAAAATTATAETAGVVVLPGTGTGGGSGQGTSLLLLGSLLAMLATAMAALTIRLRRR
jgi:hypothetical protein